MDLFLEGVDKVKYMDSSISGDAEAAGIDLQQ